MTKFDSHLFFQHPHSKHFDPHLFFQPLTSKKLGPTSFLTIRSLLPGPSPACVATAIIRLMQIGIFLYRSKHDFLQDFCNFFNLTSDVHSYQIRNATSYDHPCLHPGTLFSIFTVLDSIFGTVFQRNIQCVQNRDCFF